MCYDDDCYCLCHQGGPSTDPTCCQPESEEMEREMEMDAQIAGQIEF